MIRSGRNLDRQFRCSLPEPARRGSARGFIESEFLEMSREVTSQRPGPVAERLRELLEQIRDLVCSGCRIVGDQRMCAAKDCPALHEIESIVALQASAPVVDQRILEALAVINSAWRQKLTSRSIARQVGVSESLLRKRFKDKLGISISDYLFEKRLQRAAGLLEGTRLRVSEIAYACGFQSHSHFCHAIKRRFGLPPSLLRRARQFP